VIEEIVELLQTASPALIITAGLAIGIQHAFEPDHLAAVSTLTKNMKKGTKVSGIFLGKTTLKSSMLGALWGAGHTSTILLVGLLVAGFSLSISKEIFMGFELLVGIMLVFLGILAFLNKSLLKFKHLHLHTHVSGMTHIHAHAHDEDHKHGHKAYIIGCIHGLAGSGSIVILAAASLDSLEMVVYFILVFGIGSIIGMAIASSLIALPFVLSSRFDKVYKILRYVVGLVALMIGVSIIYEIGFVNNLFLL